ncbi:RHS repeat-associated core domain-containing protein, partial [Arcticibacter tournemirensis]
SSQSKGATIGYDPWFNLSSSIVTSGSTTGFQYGADNERVLKTNSYGGNTYTTFYVRGTEAYPLIEETAEGRKVYINGPNGLVSVKQDGIFQYPLKDHLGSTRVTVSASGSVLSHYDYLAFGSLMRSTNPTQLNYRYTGQEFDAETELQNFRARMYDSDLGIFYGTDPEEQYYSPYVYCGNNPVQMIDPSGRSAFL